jgi:hypothetical protein
VAPFGGRTARITLERAKRVDAQALAAAIRSLEIDRIE